MNPERGEDVATAQGTAAATTADPFVGTPHTGALNTKSDVVHIPQRGRHAAPMPPSRPVRMVGRYGWATFVSCVFLSCAGILALAVSGRL
ncbi:hypothetical protein [Streptomyces sp. x-80]|uniref:hypothetical protein n=1 Tax=Streptomyces sp. x-80 TaxID=2789282 RepID=UPI00397F2AB2